MKRIIFIFIISFSLNSCAFEYEMPDYRFSNFENTAVWELAKAVKADDGEKVSEILKNKKIDVDFKDPIWQQTLLTLSIVNQKKNAFISLLKAGGNPNKLTGKYNDSTPFVDAIEYQNECDLFYLENLIKYKADVNKKIVPEDLNENFSFTAGYPLLVAIGQNANGHDCLNIIKLLLANGADINCCFDAPTAGMCEGVVTKSLMLSNMETLRYFVIEKKIKIPNPAIILGAIDKSTQEVYSLKEILNTKHFRFEDFENETGKHDRSKYRNIRNEILAYLEKEEK